MCFISRNIFPFIILVILSKINELGFVVVVAKSSKRWIECLYCFISNSPPYFMWSMNTKRREVIYYAWNLRIQYSSIKTL